MGSNSGKLYENGRGKFQPTTDLQFMINGKKFCVRPGTIPHDTSLNTFIRIYAGLTGTKFMCKEGGCGVCTVILRRQETETNEEWVGSVNSCLLPIYSCHGLEVLTIEGVGDSLSGYHAAQARLAKMNGTQCGYCSPGMVMSMVGLMEEQRGKFSMADVEKHFGGNICRCTGYRPILDAFKSLAEDADTGLTAACTDIEDLPVRCAFAQQPCLEKDQDFLHFRLDNFRDWFRVRKLNDVLKILEKSHNRPYMLIGGNTGHGVYRRREDLQIFIDITGVEEMKTTMIGDTLEVGSAITLTEFIDFLNEAAALKREFSYCREFVKHLELVAHPAVRNVGTLGGNLSLKHQHPEFPSDIFLLLETVGAFLTTIDSNGIHRAVTVEDFMYKSMTKRILVKVTLPPLPPEKYSLVTFKIMPRAQNAHAMINAGFLFKFNPESRSIASARICYGGINPRFVHATNTENLLASKNLFANETISLLMASLNEELKVDRTLTEASPDYRKTLAMSLLYKAILSLAPPGRIRESFSSGGTEIHRGLSRGKRKLNASENAILKIEGYHQCAGEVKYVNDLPYMINEVWAAFVMAKEVLSTVVDIDAKDALRIPGVVAFFTAADIPGANSFMTQVFIEPLQVVEPEEVFCSGKVRYHSQPVGIILAESLDLALKAAELVKITYNPSADERKLMLTVEDVLEAGEDERIINFAKHLEAETQGNDTATTITGNIAFSSQYHFYMEPQTTVCVPTLDGMIVHCASHFLHFAQMGIAQVLNIPQNSISMKIEQIGGSFGGKNSKSVHVACAAAVACYHLRRPVRFVMSIEQNMMIIGKRFPASSYYAVEINKQGIVQKLDCTYCVNMGASRNEGPDQPSIIAYFTNLYNTTTWSLNIRGVLTDLHPHTWFRAPDALEPFAINETVMEHIAKELCLDPLDVRLANLPEDSQMRTILPEFLAQCNFEERRERVNIFNAANRWKKRGIAFVPMKYKIISTFRYGVLVTVYAIDGSVSVGHGGVEMGQGINTKMAQIAANTFGIPVENVKIEAANTFVNANTSTTGGSQSNDVLGRLVLEACNTILERMKPVREEMPSATWSELVRIAYERNVSLAAFVNDMDKDRITYDVWGVSCAEIEVDVLTGDFLLRRVDIAEDVGESLNPNIDVGQIEGAFVMGLGYWLQEKIIRNPETGEILTNRTWNYKPPVARDIPVDFRVSFLKGQNLPAGIIGAKGTGEPAICMSIVAIFALRNALESARKDAGLPYTFIELHAPTTKEDILLLSGTHFSQFQL
ncbi:xanthine dehydrogenase/oxidase-like [Lutzomyia longipalpis]|uniref:xanthine dehydrogenase/oxidase-like n=1 Tax=Lutzomyia longipalpis TaxID=7200 RepID=UPI002483B87E|nr:xanthine dehydrogenase/oxidase-like [Lutzomyia longipalpis]